MDKWSDKRMRKLMEEFDRRFERMMGSFGLEKVESDEGFKTFEKKGPGFYMRVNTFSSTKPGRFGSKSLSGTSEKKAAEVDEGEGAEEPRKLALERFKEKNKEVEE